jgi:hypothetical protein
MSDKAARIFADVVVDKNWATDAAEAEHERLQLAVVEAAKAQKFASEAWTAVVGEKSKEQEAVLDAACAQYDAALEALLKFEAEQKNGNT